MSAGTKVTYYRNRDKEYISYFNQDGDLVYCNDIKSVLLKLGASSFIDSQTQFEVCSTAQHKPIRVYPDRTLDDFKGEA